MTMSTMIKRLLRKSSRAVDFVARDGQGCTETMTKIKHTTHYLERQIVSLSKEDNETFGFNIRTYENNTTDAEVLTCVCSVKERSPAESAGLRTGDVIISINSICVEGFEHQQIVDLVQKGSCLLKMEVVRGTSVKQKELQMKLEHLQRQLGDRRAELQMLITQEERLRGVSSKPHTRAGERTDPSSDGPTQETMADPQAAPPSESTDLKPEPEPAAGEDATPQSSTGEDAAASEQEGSAESSKEPPKSDSEKTEEQNEPEQAAAGADEEKNVSEEAAEEKEGEKGGGEAAEEKEEENTNGETGEAQSEEKASEEGGEEQEDESSTPANKYYTVNYRKIKKGFAKQRISAFETLDFATMEEEDGAEDGAMTEGGAAANGADQTNGESQNGTSESADGQKTAEGQEDEKTGEEAGAEQDEEDGLEDENGAEEECDGSDKSKEKRSVISKYFTVSYRKIKKGIAKQRVDEFEFMGVKE